MKESLGKCIKCHKTDVFEEREEHPQPGEVVIKTLTGREANGGLIIEGITDFQSMYLPLWKEPTTIHRAVCAECMKHLTPSQARQLSSVIDRENAIAWFGGGFQKRLALCTPVEYESARNKTYAWLTARFGKELANEIALSCDVGPNISFVNALLDVVDSMKKHGMSIDMIDKVAKDAMLYKHLRHRQVVFQQLKHTRQKADHEKRVRQHDTKMHQDDLRRKRKWRKHK